MSELYGFTWAVFTVIFYHSDVSVLRGALAHCDDFYLAFSLPTIYYSQVASAWRLPKHFVFPSFSTAIIFFAMAPVPVSGGFGFIILSD